MQQIGMSLVLLTVSFFGSACSYSPTSTVPQPEPARHRFKLNAEIGYVGAAAIKLTTELDVRDQDVEIILLSNVPAGLTVTSSARLTPSTWSRSDEGMWECVLAFYLSAVQGWKDYADSRDLSAKIDREFERISGGEIEHLLYRGLTKNSTSEWHIAFLR